MWLPDPAVRRALRLASAMIMAGLVAACFQPLYGDRNAVGGSALRDALAAVDVPQIEAPKGTPLSRLAVETRNELLFNLTGGGGSAPPTHRLTVRLIQAGGGTVIVDPITQRPEVTNYGLDAYYTMTEIASNRIVMNGTSSTRVSFDAPGQEQRFARARALRDAETRAAKTLADMIRSRLASYFVAGT
jgi:LPS-assembly lipoprotein